MFDWPARMKTLTGLFPAWPAPAGFTKPAPAIPANTNRLAIHFARVVIGGYPFCLETDAPLGLEHEAQPLVSVEIVDPLRAFELIFLATWQVHQGLEVLGLRQHVCLEPSHLAGRSRVPFLGPSAHCVPHRRINREPIRIVRVLVARQSTVDRLPDQGEDRVLGILAGSPFVEEILRHLGQAQGIVQFAVGQRAGIRRDF